MDKMQKIILF